MKQAIFGLLAVLVGAQAMAADVGVSISVGEPGFYGRIDIGDFPRPPLILSRPIIITPVAVGVVRHPIYLHVPPGHAKDWGKHCHKYNACSEQVYFVNDSWYNDVYVPQHRERNGKPNKSNGKGNGKGKHKD